MPYITRSSQIFPQATAAHMDMEQFFFSVLFCLSKLFTLFVGKTGDSIATCYDRSGLLKCHFNLKIFPFGNKSFGFHTHRIYGFHVKYDKLRARKTISSASFGAGFFLVHLFNL